MKIIMDPSVTLVAKPYLDFETLFGWAEENELADAAFNKDTPLGQIYLPLDQPDGARIVELAGRHCYRAFSKGRGRSDYMQNILESGHGSVLEHANYTFIITGVSRSFTHELVRHRAGVAISQESQRYVNSADINFVMPPLIQQQCKNDGDEFDGFVALCQTYLEAYQYVQEGLEEFTKEQGFDGTMARKRANEAARALLPNCAETRLVWTANVRALRHVIELRGSEHADLEIRKFAVGLAVLMKQEEPDLFADVEIGVGSDHDPEVKVKHSKV